ncbi:hypothetical protein VNO77_16245 [Canavalia gladiata]|uniref:G protein-coupled receptor 107 n=1 Tax=Canavalia gladiata TaxID=3824 RepID=A0AAN9M5I0_CANGL
MGKITFPTGVTVLLLFLQFLISPSTAEIKTLTITSDSRPMVLFEKFGFTRTGHVAVSVSSVSVVAASQPDLSRLGLFLLSEESLLQVLIEIQQKPSFCVLDSHFILRLFTFRVLSPPPSASFNRTFPVFLPNEYSLFFANCAPESSVSMVVHAELFNLDPDNSRDYLSAGQTQLPSLFFLFSLAYFAFLGFWLYLFYSNKRSLHRIHLLMASLLLVKALNLICAAEDKHYVKVTGTPHGWDVLFYIFQFIRVVLLFTVIVLLGTGWSFLKPSLEEREKKVLMIVIPLQVLASVASIVIGETGPFIKNWVTWNQVLFLIDLVSCGAIIFLLVRSIRLRYKTLGKAESNLDKLILMERFFFLVIWYLFFTRFLIFVLKIVLDYKYGWVTNLAEETIGFAFCIVMLYMFRPVEKEEYFLIDANEEDVAEIAVKV